jgi:hypothetical protein
MQTHGFTTIVIIRLIDDYWGETVILLRKKLASFRNISGIISLSYHYGFYFASLKRCIP